MPDCTRIDVAGALHCKSGKVWWQYKTSNSLLNPIMPLPAKRVVVSAMDGKVVCLQYRDKLSLVHGP